MGLDVEFTGVELSKRKVEQKGLQHFINNERFADELRKNKCERFSELNFNVSFREPSDKFFRPFLDKSKAFLDKDNNFSVTIYYVLTKEDIMQLREEGFNEDRFKGTTEERFYHILMSHLCGLEDYEDKFKEFFLIMEIYY